MEPQTTEKQQGISILSGAIILVIVVVAIAGAAVSLVYPEFITLLSGTNYVSGGALYDAIYVILTLATDALYLIGGAVLVYGAVFVTYRFIQYKVSDPYK